MKNLSFFLCLLLLPQASRAVIPLELVAEFQLPDSTVDWDVQHWMDDSTFGWVAVRHDSIFFATELGGQVLTQPVLTDGICDGTVFPTHDIAICCVASDPPIQTVITMNRVMDGCIEIGQFDRFAVHDLTHGVLLGNYLDVDSEREDGAWGYVSEAHQGLMIVPAPPVISAEMILVRSGEYDNPHHDPMHTWFGASRVASFPALPYAQFIGDNVRHVSNYLSPNSNESAMSSSYAMIQDWYSDCDSGEDCDTAWSVASLSFRGRDFPSAEICNDLQSEYSCRASPITALRGLQGARYVLLNNSGELYDAATGILVWQNNSCAGAAFAVKLPGIPVDLIAIQIDERIDLHRLSDGALVEFTSPLGVIHHTLTSADGSSELVTTDGSIYRFPELTIQTTIVYSSLAESLQLIWNSLPGAVSYEVCRSTTAEGDFCEQYIHFVNDTSLVLPIQAGVPKEFLRVRAVFE